MMSTSCFRMLLFRWRYHFENRRWLSLTYRQYNNFPACQCDALTSIAVAIWSAAHTHLRRYFRLSFDAHSRFTLKSSSRYYVMTAQKMIYHVFGRGCVHSEYQCSAMLDMLKFSPCFTYARKIIFKREGQPMPRVSGAADSSWYDDVTPLDIHIYMLS